MSALALACISLALACIALLAAVLAHRAIAAQPKPFWMGAWPPAPGAIIDGAYRYDHLPFDWALPGQRFPLNDGSWIEILAKRPGLSGQQPEQVRGGEDIQAASGLHVDAGSASQARIQLCPYVTAPDGDRLPGRQSVRKSNQPVSITTNEAALEFGLEKMAVQEAAGRDAHGLNSDLDKATVDDLHTEAAFRIPLQATGVGAGDTANLTALHSHVAGVPQRDNPQPDAITPQRPPRVDDAQHCADRRTRNGQSASPVNIRKPCGKAHLGISIQFPGPSIPQGGAA